MQTKQTVVDWLAKELYTKMEMKGSGEVFDEIIKQANKIFQHQIIDAYGKIKMFAEQYYNETYGSKGSDETKNDKI